jgi:hypothetical protein
MYCTSDGGHVGFGVPPQTSPESVSGFPPYDPSLHLLHHLPPQEIDLSSIGVIPERHPLSAVRTNSRVPRPPRACGRSRPRGRRGATAWPPRWASSERSRKKELDATAPPTIRWGECALPGLAESERPRPEPRSAHFKPDQRGIPETCPPQSRYAIWRSSPTSITARRR